MTPSIRSVSRTEQLKTSVDVTTRLSMESIPGSLLTPAGVEVSLRYVNVLSKRDVYESYMQEITCKRVLSDSHIVDMLDVPWPLF